MRSNSYSVFDHVVVISLKRSTERRKYVDAHFREMGIESFSFFDATDKDDPAVSNAYKSDEVFSFPPCFRCGKVACGKPDCNNILIEPQVATFITYLRLWRWIVARPPATYLITEDDVKFHETMPSVLTAIEKWTRSGNLPFTTDRACLLRLGWALCNDHESAGTPRIAKDCRMSNPCHAITSKYANAMLERYNGVNHTVDVYQHRLAPKPGEAFTIFPPIASELSWSVGTFDSEIHPKRIRSDYLRKTGNIAGANANDDRVKNHVAHRSTSELDAVGTTSTKRTETIEAQSDRRWSRAAAYGLNWSDRNAALVDLLKTTGLIGGIETVSEYGCGPHTPVSKYLPQKTVTSYDQWSWPHGNRIINLNNCHIVPPRADLGVLSGVIEYLDNPSAVLKTLFASHEFLLVSYAYSSSSTDSKAAVSELNERAAKNGWRNHFKLHEIVNLVSLSGSILMATHWNNQVLFLLKRNKQRSAVPNQIRCWTKGGPSNEVWNWGDAISPTIYEMITGSKPTLIDYTEEMADPHFVMVGSTLKWRCSGTMLWGTGEIRAEIDPMFKESTPLSVHAVRGPATREKLLQAGVPCPEIYGDPALVIPRFYQPKVEKLYKLGVIPHYIDRTVEMISKFRGNPDILVLDITQPNAENPVFDFIDQVLSCERIVSSSLHGIILADAYNIPNAWIEWSDNVVGGGFKFRDYWMGIERPIQSSLHASATVPQIISCIDDFTQEHGVTNYDPTRLINAFPR